jgi:serine protease
MRSILRFLPTTLFALCGIAVTLPAQSRADEPTRLIIKWKDSAAGTHTQTIAQASTRFRSRTGHQLQYRRSIDSRLDVMQLESHLQNSELDNALNQLRSDSRVEYAVEDERRQALATYPSDSYFLATSGRTGQWYLNAVETASINAIGAWDLSKGGSSTSGVIVAVVDTGVRFDHPDLSGKLLSGYDFVSCDQANCSGSGVTYLTANDGNGWDSDASDPGDWITQSDLTNHSDVFPSANCSVENSSWHGTRVAGIIGAATDNGLGIAGTGWNAHILPVRVLGKCGGYDSDIIAGIKWAAGLTVSGVPTNTHPAKIINLSLGGSGSCSSAYQDVFDTLATMGVSVVASAGNDSAVLNTPANCSGVISVVGVRNSGTKVGFSSVGQATIAAPAGNCVNSSGACLYSIDTTYNLGTTTPGTNDYTDQTNTNLGTSFSAPIVSGTIALMLGANSNLTPTQIISTLQSMAKAFPTTATNTCQATTSTTALSVNESECNCTSDTCGAGLVNAYQAVLAVSSSSSSSSSNSSATSSSSASSASSSSVSSSTSAGAATGVSTTNTTHSGGGPLDIDSLILLTGLLPARRWAHKKFTHRATAR